MKKHFATNRLLRVLTRASGLALLAGMAAGVTTRSLADELLFDFGAGTTQTEGGTVDAPMYWNNVTGEGTDDFGVLPNLMTTDGTPTDISLEMVSRFNGANENGAANGGPYPGTATRDSLFGNTEAFSSLENITPIFKLTGLDPSVNYTLTFYASRQGVTDNRETRYTITGNAESFVELNPANNVTGTVQASAVAPNESGEIQIALTPGPNNNNGNHFTYLGVLQVDSTAGKMLIDFGAGGSTTDYVEPGPSSYWNNITESLGATEGGTLSGLNTTNGTASTMSLEIVSRFNSSNSNGATNSTVFPASATRDSLFGNTESFNGLANITPVFKLTGLDTNSAYSFTFYGSRTGASDNRETRYTVTGVTEAFADLNTANNTNNTATVSKIQPTAAGEITIALTPGPNNNNGMHFVYLGAMRVNYSTIRAPRLLFDFGAGGRPTLSDPDNSWNNVTDVIGSNPAGSLTNLVLTDGTPVGITLQTVSRFNGANENGTEFSDLFPLDATRDSLYGNTEEWSGLANVTPIFKLTGLNPATAYDLTFYASRMGVGDNRETRYTVTGLSESFADLDAANNEFNTTAVTNVLPSSTGEITVALTPGPNNDNANHFTYLGVMQVDWTAPAESQRPSLSDAAYSNGVFSLKITGTAGKTYQIQRTRDFSSWANAQAVTLAGNSQTVQITQPEPYYFYRAVEQ